MVNHGALLTVAIVDDDEFILDAIKTVLDDQCWSTRTYASGEEFLLDVEINEPDCIILDSHLIGLSGSSVAKIIKTHQNCIPIIILTAYPESSQTLKIIELGVSNVLLKPVTAEILIEEIKETVRSL